VDERPARSPATWLLLALAAVAAALPAVFATSSLLTALGLQEVDAEDTAAAGLAGVHGADALRNAEGFAAAAVGAAAVVGLVLLVGLARWRAWAREGALAVFGLVGALLCLFSAAGVTGEARNGGLGLLGGLVLLLAAGLAVSPPVCADFDRRRIAAEVRERKRREQERRDRVAGSQDAALDRRRTP
jgi:hypothetical protein